MTDIAERFARETADHRMTVLHDDGLYRHLRFRPATGPSFYWFDLVTIPGTLLFQGDGDSFTFRRVEDMFEFFRGPVGRINPHYWSEKVTSGRENVTEYDEAKFVAAVEEDFAAHHEFDPIPSSTAREVIRQLLDPEILCHEQTARDAVEHFECDGFRFHDTWEWNLHGYSWWFLWACQAIVWGIACYDAGSEVPFVTPPAATPRRSPGALAPAAVPAVVDLQPVGGVL